MKKILVGILTFLGIGLSFCSADTYYLSGFGSFYRPNLSDLNIPFSSNISVDFFTCENDYCAITLTTGFADSCFSVPGDDNSYDNSLCSCYIKYIQSDGFTYNLTDCGNTFDISLLQGRNTFEDFVFSVGGGGEDTGNVSTIDVYYNNGNSTETITCDGTQAISINGLSTITSTNTFTPYYNISYTDEDNQKLTESYSKSNLYLSGGLFKKTYTGDNERILTDTIESPNSSFSGYLPVFDFTGDTIVNSGNVFNNFSDNALKVLLSNIPSYIQYITIFMILVFLFSFIRRFKRKS